MKTYRSFIGVLIAACICFSFLFAGCKPPRNIEAEITATVTSYMDEVRSVSFAENEYRSLNSKDTPFASVLFKDEEVRLCMHAALQKMQYEIKETAGSIKENSGTCTILLRIVDIEKVLASFGNEWITTEKLTAAIYSEDAPTRQEEAVLFLVYDDTTLNWSISDSTSIAIAQSVPYSEINLFSRAGNPDDAFRQFIDELKTGQQEKITQFLTDAIVFDQLFPEDQSSFNRRAFFVKLHYEILSTIMEEKSCKMDVSFDYIDLQAVTDIVLNSAEMQCEMFKFIFTGLLVEPEAASMDAFRKRNDELCFQKIHADETPRLQDSFVFQMELSEDGQQWKIIAVPAFMTKTDYKTADANDDDVRSGAGMALIELYDEEVITKKQRDDSLKKLGFENLLYSSRKVVSSVDYMFLDGQDDTYLSYGVFDASSTEVIWVCIWFKNTWPKLDLLFVVRFLDSDVPDAEYAISTFDDRAEGCGGWLLYEDNQNWPKGKYTVEVFIEEDMTLLGSRDFEVK